MDTTTPRVRRALTAAGAALAVLAVASGAAAGRALTHGAPRPAARLTAGGPIEPADPASGPSAGSPTAATPLPAATPVPATSPAGGATSSRGAGAPATPAAPRTPPPAPSPSPVYWCSGYPGPVTTYVSGIVVDTAGHPLRGIGVYTGACFGNDPELTGANGRFSVPCAPAARLPDRWLVASPWRWSIGHDFLGSDGPTTTADVGFARVGGEADPVDCTGTYRIVLQQAAAAHVTVAYPAGSHVDPERLFLHTEGGQSIEFMFGTGDDGTVTIPALEPGSYTVQRDHNPESAAFTVGPGETAEATITVSS
jgi:hypothetical protein